VRQELAVGQVRYVLNGPADPHEALDEIVIGSKVFIGNGPVVTIAVVVGRSKIEVAETLGMTTPMQQLATHKA
jgi:hypothetical protein